MILVFEEVVHPQPEIFQAELAKVFARDGKWVEIVLVEVFAKLALPFLVFSPQKTEPQKEERYNDRSDDVDRKLALQGINHIANISFAAVATGLRPVSTNCADGKLHDHHRFPTRLESVMFSTSVSIGRARANATASATCVTLIMRSRGHLPSTRLQMSVAVAAG